MNTDEPMRLEKRNGIALITFTRPESLNVLGSVVLERMRDLLTDLESEEKIRVVVITGEKNFSAGADIRELRAKDPKQAGAFARLGHEICGMIESSRKPVIAAICGFALGGGCEIALACDLRVAAENAKFGQPEVNIGIIPGFGGTQRLARIVGIGKAKEMVLTGRIFGARDAESIGLVNRVTADNDLMKEVEAMAAFLAQKSPSAIRRAKKAMNEYLKIKDGLELEIESFSECFATDDHREGIEAFLAKRQPKFSGT